MGADSFPTVGDSVLVKTEQTVDDWLVEHGPVTSVCLMGSDDQFAWVSPSVLATAPTEQFVVIVGNVIDGLTLWGPFDDAGDAGDWANENINDDWTTVHLDKPKDR